MASMGVLVVAGVGGMWLCVAIWQEDGGKWDSGMWLCKQQVVGTGHADTD